MCLPNMDRSRLENVVDAVAKALGVDTGTCSESMFEDAVNAAEKAMTPSAPGYLVVHKDGLHVYKMHEKYPKPSKAVVHTMGQLTAWCEEWGVDNFMCSSSIDFPEDSTDDDRVIALCNEIRGEQE